MGRGRGEPQKHVLQLHMVTDIAVRASSAMRESRNSPRGALPAIPVALLDTRSPEPSGCSSCVLFTGCRRPGRPSFSPLRFSQSPGE